MEGSEGKELVVVEIGKHSRRKGCHFVVIEP